MADENKEGNQKLLTWGCAECSHAFGELRPHAQRVSWHYAAVHGVMIKRPGDGVVSVGGTEFSIEQLRELDERDRGELSAADVIRAATRGVLGLDLAVPGDCCVKGCRDKRAHFYGVSVDGDTLAIQLPLCSDHGGRFLIGAGQLFAELAKGTNADG